MATVNYSWHPFQEHTRLGGSMIYVHTWTRGPYRYRGGVGRRWSLSCKGETSLKLDFLEECGYQSLMLPTFSTAGGAISPQIFASHSWGEKVGKMGLWYTKGNYNLWVIYDWYTLWLFLFKEPRSMIERWFEIYYIMITHIWNKICCIHHFA